MPDVSGGPLMLLTGLEQELARKMCAFHIAVFFFFFGMRVDLEFIPCNSGDTTLTGPFFGPGGLFLQQKHGSIVARYAISLQIILNWEHQSLLTKFVSRWYPGQYASG